MPNARDVRRVTTTCKKRIRKYHCAVGTITVRDTSFCVLRRWNIWNGWNWWSICNNHSGKGHRRRGSFQNLFLPRMARPDFGMQATDWCCINKISRALCQNYMPKVYWFWSKLSYYGILLINLWYAALLEAKNWSFCFFIYGRGNRLYCYAKSWIAICTASLHM